MAFAVRRWVVLTALVAILVVGLVAAVMVCYQAFVEPPTARAVLHVKPNYVTGAYDSWRYSERMPADLRLQCDLIRSHEILAAALRDREVAGCPTLKEKRDPVDWLQKTLRVVSIRDGDSGTLVISLSGGPYADLVLIVNAIVDAYLAEAVEAPRAKRKQVMESQLKLLEWTLQQFSKPVPQDDKFRETLRRELMHEIENMKVELEEPPRIIEIVLRQLSEAPKGDTEFQTLSRELEQEIEVLRVKLKAPARITVLDRPVQPN